MKTFYNYLGTLAVILMLSTNLSAQISCNTETFLALDNEGNATLFPQNILEGNNGTGPFQIKKIGEDYQDSITFDCSESGQEVQVAVINQTTMDECWGIVLVEDRYTPVPYCVSLGSATTNGSEGVELWAIDYDIGSFDNCSDTTSGLSFTFGEFAFDFEDVFINGTLITPAVEFYFNEKGPLSTVANAPQWIVNDYNAGLIQRWDPQRHSSSQQYLLSNNSTTELVTISMSVTDASGNSDYCEVSLTLTGGEPNEPGDCIDNMNVNVSATDCSIQTLNAADFVPAGFAYQNAQISLDDITYASLLTGLSIDLHDDVPVYVSYNVGANDYSCLTTISAVDRVAPVAIADQNIVVQLTEDPFGQYTATITPEVIDDGSYDLCTDVTLAISQSSFNTADIGTITVVLTVTDEFCNTNQAFANVDVLGPQSPPVSPCTDTTEVNIPFWTGCELTQLSIEDFGIPLTDTEAGISLDGNNFSQSIDGLAYFEDDTDEVFIQYTEGQDLEECSTILKVLDQRAPVVVVESEITLVLPDNGVATLTPEEVDNGSYAFCGDISLTLSQEQFTAADIGENIVVLRATRDNGVWNETWCTVTVIGTDCDVQVSDIVAWPLSEITITDPGSDPSDLTPQYIVDNLGYTMPQVQPTWPNGICDVIEFAYSDVVFNVGSGIKIVRTFTVINWDNGSVASSVQTINNFFGPAILICTNGIPIAVSENNPVQLSPENLLSNFTGQPALLTLLVEDQNSVVITNNVITHDLVGETLTYTVTDTSSNAFCSGTLEIIDGGTNTDCGFEITEDLTWPFAEIQISDPTAMATELDPETLVNDYGFVFSQVHPTWPPACDDQIAAAYSDEVFNINGPSGFEFKIIRTWTVIDWWTMETYSFTHQITNTEDPATYICDTLPRTAPFGDCESRHTADDDVEWPADIEVSDHRISPSELVAFSNIDTLDAQPSFYNEPWLYSANYVDQLIDLNSTQIILGRVWTVDRNDGSELSWNYTQTLTVNFTEFNNLVTVGTSTGRGLEDVMINGAITTDENGRAIFLGEDDLVLEKANDAKEGLDMRDIILIRDHILDRKRLDKYGELAADANSDGKITGSDILEILKVIQGVQLDFVKSWEFVNTTDQTPLGIKPKGAFIGVKPGDVDDSYASLKGKAINDYKLQYDDQLLNIGEQYDMDLHISDVGVMRGIELHFEFDAQSITIESITYGPDDTETLWNVDDEGILTVAKLPENVEETIGVEGSPVLTIHFTAAVNGILSKEIALAEGKRSFFVDNDYNYNILSDDVQGVISGVFEDPNNALSFVKVYPNPATDVVTFELAGQDMSSLTVKLFNATGKTISSTSGQNKIDVSTLPSGVYFYQISNGKESFVNKLFVVK